MMINRELTNIEKVAVAITSLTYAEMIEVGAGLRDIIGDRVSDNDQVLGDAMGVADILHSWAAGELVEENEGHG